MRTVKLSKILPASRTNIEANYWSITVDYRGKGFYSSYTQYMSILKFLIFLLVCFFCALPVYASEPDTTWNDCNTSECQTAQDPQLRAFINKRLNFYNSVFPDIFFIHLPNHDQWIDSILALEMLLGYQATSLDFEHPTKLSEDLLYVTVARIQKMLLYGHSAAFLFRVGVQAVAKRENVCVITMNPDAIASSSRAASDYMLAVPLDTLDTLPVKYQLDGMQLLEFIIDHEVSHCLDSYYNGPVPMSAKDFWGHFMHYKREMLADTFALARHVSQYGNNSQFIQNFINMRRLCLITGDPGTCSANTLSDLIDNNISKLSNKSVAELFKLVTELRLTDNFEYDQFVNYLFASIKAMQLLKVELDESCIGLTKPEGYTLNKQLILNILDESKKSYRLLFSTELEAQPYE